MMQESGPSTRCVHTCSDIDPATGAIIPPIYANAAFAYNDLDSWRAVALKQAPGDIYSRNTNPTTTLFEKKMAALEGTEAATSFATGMAAISTTLFALLRPGNTAIAIKDTYGATYLHFTQILPQFKINCRVCETESKGKLEKVIKEGCDLLYLETPTNPTLKVVDLNYFTNLAHKARAIVVVDNTFATPINQNPVLLGADIVIHSATKYINGHGDVLGGVVAGKKDLIEKIFRYRELTGPSLDAFSAFLLLRSLKTLGIRIKRQNFNASGLARFLEEQDKVARVFYPGLPSHPGNETAKSQMRGFGGVLSFELKGGYESVKNFLPKLKLAYMAANLGQIETVVGPPSTTSHVELTDVDREKTGVPEGLIRYSVGIEELDDLKADIKQALEQI